jgi:hypothetical protein
MKEIYCSPFPSNANARNYDERANNAIKLKLIRKIMGNSLE